MSDTVLFIHNILKEHVHDDELTPARARVGEARQQAFILDAEEGAEQEQSSSSGGGAQGGDHFVSERMSMAQIDRMGSQLEKVILTRLESALRNFDLPSLAVTAAYRAAAKSEYLVVCTNENEYALVHCHVPGIDAGDEATDGSGIGGSSLYGDEIRRVIAIGKSASFGALPDPKQVRLKPTSQLQNARSPVKESDTDSLHSCSLIHTCAAAQVQIRESPSGSHDGSSRVTALVCTCHGALDAPLLRAELSRVHGIVA